MWSPKKEPTTSYHSCARSLYSSSASMNFFFVRVMLHWHQEVSLVWEVWLDQLLGTGYLRSCQYQQTCSKTWDLIIANRECNGLCSAFSDLCRDGDVECFQKNPGFPCYRIMMEKVSLYTPLGMIHTFLCTEGRQL